ncbi:hypothetical protein HS088_TW02G01052 [Tripterygium wilfordii]|uniref:Transmembrane protein n=1 Tax=Tripterygium wilfordii TaxID=458696 RepID=A0A7J7E046_TRIWF|nr:hypothetical protein HS088_TW02G01052 [Tripterygium wilfordii]
MEWFYTRRRRGPEWKQGWTGQTLSSISTPPLPLLTIFGIVIVLLWLSQYTEYKAELHQRTTNFQLFIFLLPILLIIFMASYSAIGRFSYWQSQNLGGGSPWGIAILVVLVLLLVCYQSYFHSKWFGPLWR